MFQGCLFGRRHVLRVMKHCEYVPLYNIAVVQWVCTYLLMIPCPRSLDTAQPMATGRFASEYIRTYHPHATPFYSLRSPLLRFDRPVIGLAIDVNVQSFLFYWLLAPNVTSFRRNRALRGRIAPFPGAEGNSVAIFRARVASATEEVRFVCPQCWCRDFFIRFV